MINVFIVDDHSLIRDGLKSILDKDKEIQVVGTSDSQNNALKFINENNTQIDLVLVDYNLKNGSGVELINTVSKKYKSIKSIAISMHLEKPFVLNMFRAGAKAYFHKSFDKDELFVAIRRVVNGHFYTDNLDNDFVAKIQSHLSSTDKNIKLSKREKEIIKHYASGESTREIAENLFISIKTVESHRANVYQKLNINNLQELTKHSIVLGITSLTDHTNIFK